MNRRKRKMAAGGLAALLSVCVCMAALPAGSDAARSLTRGGINTINGAVTLEESGLVVPCPTFELVFEHF